MSLLLLLLVLLVLPLLPLPPPPPPLLLLLLLLDKLACTEGGGVEGDGERLKLRQKEERIFFMIAASWSGDKNEEGRTIHLFSPRLVPMLQPTASVNKFLISASIDKFPALPYSFVLARANFQ